MSASLQPSAAVLAAFGASGSPVLLPGGRGLTWRAGDVVVRPAEALGESEWKSDVLVHLARSDEFTVARPVRDDRGDWVLKGWEALEWIPGVADPSRVDDVVRAGAAFHRAIAGLPQPPFIAASSHAWSRADRIAWEEGEPLPDDPLLQSLAQEYRPVDEPSQVIHADLIGNVLFADDRPPAVIDWAPYWRPSGLGAAIVVADAVCWHGHPIERLIDDYGVPQWRQLLLRALVFRMATLHLLGLWDEAHSKRHAPVVRAVIALRG
jgi:uncharacterized protein (TIGR02569 family)